MCTLLLSRLGCGRLCSGAAPVCRLLSTDSLPDKLKLELTRALESSKFQPASADIVRRYWRHFEDQQKTVSAEATSGAHQHPGQFVLMLPPPNVTGVLHMGHALAFVLQDVLVRWQRVQGRRTLWVPGFDHAGIATQVLMEKKLRKELGLDRRQIGRERFVAEAAKWADLKRTEIRRQMELLGLAVNWSEEFFTYDQKHCQVVTEAFVRLHDDGQIYRSKQLVNWSCALESAISDIEVETLEIAGPTRLRVPGHPQPVEFGRLHRFEYPLADDAYGSSGGGGGSVGGVVVATTRPETMLGDTAVAVHPADARYSALIGRHLRHPLAVGATRLLPIVAHASVDPDFGTGAVKLTPGHSRADWAIATDLAAASSIQQPLTVFTETGSIGDACDAPPELVGAPRFAARAAVIDRLVELGLYRGSEEHSMSLPICSRSGDVVEQMLKSQWFVRCSGGMSERAAEAVRSGRLRVQPAGFAAEWLEWMRRIGDWCVSRQIWWGHQVPAYEVCSRDGRSLGWVVGRTESEATERATSRFGESSSAGDLVLRRDPDVLDTWFSSGLLPLSLSGWPHGSAGACRLPHSLLETGHDILFFWAARMVMLTEQLAGRLPFHSVLLNGLVCDSRGRKMSKSQGNVVDPVGLLDQGGPDALRLALCSHRFQLERVAFDQQLVDACSRLLNKLWQSHRFLRPRLQREGLLGCWDSGQLLDRIEAAASQLDKVDTWLLSRLASLAEDCHSCLSPDASMQLQEAANRLRHFWVAEFCDVGLECLKSPDASPAATLVACLASGLFLRLLYPFCPHTCELLWRGAHAASASFAVAADCHDWTPLTGAVGESAAAATELQRLQRWRSRGQEELMAGLVMPLIARCLDWRALLKPSDPAACVLLYNSAKCPIDATLYMRMLTQLGRTRLQLCHGDEQGRVGDRGGLLCLELCEGLHFAAPLSTLRIDEAAKELEARRQKQEKRRAQLLMQAARPPGESSAAAAADSATTAAAGGNDSEGQTEAARKKLVSISDQIESLTHRLNQLTAAACSN